MQEYGCCGYQEGCGFICPYCKKENNWVSNYSFMQAENNEYDKHICKFCNKEVLVNQCLGCN